MKIESGNPPVNADPRVAQQVQQNAEAVKSETQVQDAAKVTISESAATLKAIQEEVENLPEVRSEVVERIRSEIEAGTYARPADKVAEKMLVDSLIESLFQKS